MQNKRPLVSVIIPAYNEEKSIGRCIESLFLQTVNNIEIIVVNDGSTDLTQQIASKYKIKIINLSHGGPGRAKNRGAQIALGEILVFLDADMYIDKNYIKNIIHPILKKKNIATYTVKEYVANQEKLWSRCWNINLDLPTNLRINTDDKNLGLAFRAIRKTKYLEAKGFNPKWGYIDDKSLLQKLKIDALPVSNAICYHYNPETLKEVFLSARWIGRCIEFKLNIRNLMKYSIINSIIIGVNKIINGAPFRFLIFKIIFDLGIFTGIIIKNSRFNYSK